MNARAWWSLLIGHAVTLAAMWIFSATAQSEPQMPRGLDALVLPSVLWLVIIGASFPLFRRASHSLSTVLRFFITSWLALSAAFMLARGAPSPGVLMVMAPWALIPTVLATLVFASWSFIARRDQSTPTNTSA